MEKIFENISAVTPENYREMLRFHTGIRYKNLNRFFWFIPFFALLCILELALKELFLAFLLLFFTVFLCFYPFLLRKLIISKKLRIVQKTDATLFLGPMAKTFYDDFFEITSPQSSTRIFYSQVYEAYESEDCFYIYLSLDKFVFLPKSAFSIGTPQAFSNFLRYKLAARFKER